MEPERLEKIVNDLQGLDKKDLADRVQKIYEMGYADGYHIGQVLGPPLDMF